jgi:CHASE2 domain-containing sensor protein
MSEHATARADRHASADRTRRRAEGATSVPLDANPFPGLRPYGASEGHLFFGRERHIEALLEKLCAQRFSAVIGVSGSGKSSLVLAGVSPRLMRGYRAASGGEREPARSSWRIANMRPGDDPVRNLAVSLSQVSQHETSQEDRSVDVDDIATDAGLDFALREGLLRRSQQGLVAAASGLGLSPNENLLLVVDQFEELFRFRELSLRRDPVSDPAAAFVKLLLRATEQARVPIYVMLTMRSDFLGDCVQFAGLAEAINEGQYLLPLLNRDERERVIRGPLGVVHAQIAPALVQRLLNDARDMTDQLPVLQHALMRSFELWRSRPEPEPQLGWNHYELAGGMQAALSKHAEEVFSEVQAQLAAEGVRVTEKLFRALTERGAHGRGVRRPCRASEVLAAADTTMDVLRKVVGHFASASCGFVVVQPADQELAPDSLLDLSHEALMRVWGRLQRWSDDEIAFANQLLALKEAQRKWEEGRAGLLRDPELSLVLAWVERERLTPAAAARYQVDPAKLDAFLKASTAAQAAAAAAELDAKTLRRFRKIFSETKTGTLVSLLAVLLIVIVHGSGLLDGVLYSSTRLNRLAVSSLSASRDGLDGKLHEQLVTVLSDDETFEALKAEQREGGPVGAAGGAAWRVLYAELTRRLADAGAKALVFDRYFLAPGEEADEQVDAELVEIGTSRLAESFLHARSKGTAVVIAGAGDTDPRIRAALEAVGPPGTRFALGAEASSAIEIADAGAAVFLPLLLKRVAGPNLAGLALAGVSGFWRTPNAFLDEADRTIFLGGGGAQREVGFAGLGLPFREAADVVQEGDVPARQILDLSAGEPKRGRAGVVPFEQVVQSPAPRSRFEGKLVLVGTHLSQPKSHPEYHPGYEVMQCGSTPWSCRMARRSGMSLHLAAVNSLLEGRALRIIAPFSQLLVILALCACVAWQCVRNRNRSWLRRGALLGLMLADLLLVAAAGLWLGLIMDEAYHLIAMLFTYALTRRLDRHEAASPTLAGNSPRN